MLKSVADTFKGNVCFGPSAERFVCLFFNGHVIVVLRRLLYNLCPVSFQCPPDAPKSRRAAENQVEFVPNPFTQVGGFKVHFRFKIRMALDLITDLFL